MKHKLVSVIEDRGIPKCRKNRGTVPNPSL